MIAGVTVTIASFFVPTLLHCKRLESSKMHKFISSATSVRDTACLFGGHYAEIGKVPTDVAILGAVVSRHHGPEGGNLFHLRRDYSASHGGTR